MPPKKTRATRTGDDQAIKKHRRDHDSEDSEEEPLEAEDLFDSAILNRDLRDRRKRQRDAEAAGEVPELDPADQDNVGLAESESDVDELDEIDDEMKDFIVDSDSDVSEISYKARLEVDKLLDRRHRVERKLQKKKAIEQHEADYGTNFFKNVEDDVDDLDEDLLFEEDELIEEDRKKKDKSKKQRAGADGDDGDGSSSSSESDRGTGGGRTGAGGSSSHRSRRTEDELYRQGLPLENSNFDWANPVGGLNEWLTQDAPRRLIKNRIFNFFLSYSERGQLMYQDRVRAMVQNNAQSFEVSFMHLGAVYDSKLAIFLGDAPDHMLELIDEAANFFVFRHMCPEYDSIHRRIRVRISDLPVIDPIRDFRQIHRNALVRVEGVVIRRSPVYPQLLNVRYDCARCHYIIGPVLQRADRETRVAQCPACHSKGPFRVNVALTEFRNHQTVVLQEPPGKVPPGRLPRSLEVILTGDIIDCAKPGEEVEVIGMYRNSFDPLLNHRQGFPVFTTVLVGNNVLRRTSDLNSYRLPADDREKIEDLAKHPNIKKKIVQSIAPSIHGREDIKLGLLLALLGGVAKEDGQEKGHRIRGDINVLIVGDPGTAKSQCLKFVEKVSNRAVFTTGRGSSAVGLTASVQRDPVTGDFTLEGGALVIADRGVCLIDEFDKMSDQDRTSIHEAMEQQTISISKGGIVTQLSARCSVIAAANPIGGRYDPSVSFESNVELTTPILSRFDLLFVIRDEVNAEQDIQLAQFICGSHIRSHPTSQHIAAEKIRQHQHLLNQLRQQHMTSNDDAEKEAIISTMQQAHWEMKSSTAVREDDDPNSDKPLSQPLLKKYLLFARAKCRPSLANVDTKMVEALFSDLRQESKHGGGVPITVRHLESVLRLSEAHAKLHLRDFVIQDDMNAAASLFLRCFLGTQKYSMRLALQAKFQRFLESDIEPMRLLLHKLRSLVKLNRGFQLGHVGVEPTTVEIDCAELDAQVAGMSISKEAVSTFYASSLFKNEFELINGPDGIPLRVRHTLLKDFTNQQ